MDDDMKFILACAVIGVLLGYVQAVRPGTTKTISGPTMASPTTTNTLSNLLQLKVVLERSTVERLMAMRPDGGSTGYQGGYYDALDDVRALLGLGRPRFRSGPSATAASDPGYTLPYIREGYWRLNITGKEKIQYVNSNIRLCECQQNITEVRIWKK